MEKTATSVHRLRLSPNEEARFVREELERRRKMRVQQVREQERYIAQQVRHGVQERKEKELNNLRVTLRDEWKNQHGAKLQSLEKLQQDSIRDVGQSYRRAKHSEPDWYALSRIAEEKEERAIRRHQEARRDLASQRQKEAQCNQQTEARKKALIIEKKRAAKVASLPQPVPNPIESIEILPRMANVQHFSFTYCHVPETPVDNSTDIVQSDPQQGAMLEAQRLDKLEWQKVWNEQKQLERAQLRGGHALQKEKVVQVSARLLCELEQLQHADLQERKQVVYNIPEQAFQSLHRYDERQRELEIAFQDLYTGREVRDDVIVPEPLPTSSDKDLDVTLKFTPCEKTEAEESAAPLNVPVVNSGQTAVKRLLKHIRSQREQTSLQELPTGQGRAKLDNTSIETGSLTKQEWEQAPSLQGDKSSQSHAENAPTGNEETILDGSMPPLEEHFTKTRRGLWEWEQFRQQEDQLSFLYQLKGKKRRSLELQLQEAQLYMEMPENAV